MGNWVLERLVDAAADELEIDGAELRRVNFIPPDEFPYTIPTGNVYDSGDYPGVLDRALGRPTSTVLAGRAGAGLAPRGATSGSAWPRAQQRSTY